MGCSNRLAPEEAARAGTQPGLAFYNTGMMAPCTGPVKMLLSQ